jgi:hypothetical protein
MKCFTGYVLLTIAVLGWQVDRACGEIRVHATVDSATEIYPGDSFIYSIVIEGGDKAAQVDLGPIAKYNPQPTGNQSSVQIVGRTTTTTYTMNYSIAVSRPGKIRLDPVTVTVRGKRFRTNPVVVTVSKPGKTDKLKLECLLSEKKCYVGQPIVMTVKWYIMAEVRNSVFNVPVFGSKDFYFEDMHEGRSARRGQMYSISNVPVLITEEHKLINGVRTGIISFSKVLIPKRSGRLLLEPVSVATNVAVGRVRTRDIFSRYRTQYERFSVNSDSIELEVLPLPEQGRPVEFYGLVGRYNISASAKPTTVSVGDPITLTIRIGGRYLKPIQWPSLEKVASLAGHFKIPTEKSPATIERGSKVFTQTIRASDANVREIPAIGLAYFDPAQGKYVVAKSEPIKLTVTPTKVLTISDMQGLDFAPVNKEIEAIKQGLSENYIGHDVLENMSFSAWGAAFSAGYATVWGVPLLALIFSCVYRVFGDRSPGKVAARRRRTAAGRAVKQLRTLGGTVADQRHELLVSAMKQYVGERFDKTSASLTPYDCEQAIVSATGDSETAEQYCDMIADCEAARYASGQTDVDSPEVNKAIDLVRMIEKKSKR